MSLFGRRDEEDAPMGNEDSAVLPEEGEEITAPSFGGDQQVGPQVQQSEDFEPGRTGFEVGEQGDELVLEPTTPEPAPQEVATPEAEEASVGLYGKFRVERSDGRDRPGGDKADARYFVLDYVHDPYARLALRAYIDALKADGAEPELMADLNRELGSTRRQHQAKRRS